MNEGNNILEFMKSEGYFRFKADATVSSRDLYATYQQWCEDNATHAPWFEGADLLIAADCTAYAYGNFHHAFMSGKVTMIGCPKLDAIDYSEKLTQIFKHNNIRSVTVTRMTVPCCGGLPFAVKTAIQNSGKAIPLHIVTISPNGQIIP